MDHDQVIRTHIPERYFLGELPPEEREDFEEHLADCSACRKDLAVTDIFAANARAVFEDEARDLVADTVTAPRWLDFLRPRAFPLLGFSSALNVALFLYAGYGATLIYRDSRPGVSEIFNVRPPARRAISVANKVIPVSASKTFVVVRFDLLHHYQRYSYSIDGARQTELTVAADANSLDLTIPIRPLRSGQHTVRVTGWDGQNEIEIGNCILGIQAS